MHFTLASDAIEKRLEISVVSSRLLQAGYLPTKKSIPEL
jgi:hypothetical protein